MPIRPQQKRPISREDWDFLGFEINTLFDGAPIDEEELFAGRATEVKRILESVVARSKHVVLYGERGVGKTSLSNIFWKRFNKMTQSFVVARVQAGPHDSFSSLWIRALEELRASGVALDRANYVDFRTDFETVSPSVIRRELQKCHAGALPIIIVDEYNEVIDKDAKRLTANLIKEFYDFSISTTVILVGVAENVTELLGDHESAVRAIVEIRLDRMSDHELKEIIQKRAARTIIRFSGDAMWTVICLSRGLPYFTQTLSRYAALKAIENKRLEITNADVEASLSSFIQNSETSLKDAYRNATQSNQENYFRQSLLACALAPLDDDGFFTANDLVEPYSALLKEKKRIAHFEKHLRRFSSADGGNILIKRGGDRQQRFRFKNPMMHPYVIIRGIDDKMIDEASKIILFRKEQGTLPI